MVLGGWGGRLFIVFFFALKKMQWINFDVVCVSLVRCSSIVFFNNKSAVCLHNCDHMSHDIRNSWSIHWYNQGNNYYLHIFGYFFRFFGTWRYTEVFFSIIGEPTHFFSNKRMNIWHLKKMDFFHNRNSDLIGYRYKEEERQNWWKKFISNN